MVGELFEEIRLIFIEKLHECPYEVFIEEIFI